jgi:antitoxin (DNA-binding transcriptional repressor) of toxin-antitoxin stability system
VKTLEASKAAANFSRVLNAVHSLHESFEIVRKGVPCAYLVPLVGRLSISHELADDLAGVELSTEDRRSFAADIRKGRKALKSLKNPWG